jgi:hypothetical protein
MTDSPAVHSNHLQGMHDVYFCSLQSLDEIRLTIFVHEETNAPPIHSIDWNPIIHMAMQRLKHQTVTSECDDNIGPFRHRAAVTLRQAIARSTPLLALDGDKGNAFKPSSSRQHGGPRDKRFIGDTRGYC